MRILTRIGIDDKGRHDLIYAWTSGRTTSSKELRPDELQNLIWKLENDFHFQSNIVPLTEIERRKKRAQVLAIAQRCGIHDGASFTKFNSFMKNSSILKKPLNEYALDELDRLVKQFRALEQNYLASAEHAGTKAYYHSKGLEEPSDN